MMDIIRDTTDPAFDQEKQDFVDWKMNPVTIAIISKLNGRLEEHVKSWINAGDPEGLRRGRASELHDIIEILKHPNNFIKKGK